MKRIVVTLEVNEEKLTQAAGKQSRFSDAVSGELGWLNDSGMYCVSWEEIPCNK